MARPKLKQIQHRPFWQAWLPIMASTVKNGINLSRNGNQPRRADGLLPDCCVCVCFFFRSKVARYKLIDILCTGDCSDWALVSSIRWRLGSIIDYQPLCREMSLSLPSPPLPPRKISSCGGTSLNRSCFGILKLINNSSSLNKGNHKREGGFDTRS